VIRSVAVLEPDRRQQAAAREGVRLGEVWASATCLARDLVNEPANVMTPTYLAKRAEEIAEAEGLGLKIWSAPTARSWRWAPTSASRRAARSRPSSST
jgi:leucyl aminopeptidase